MGFLLLRQKNRTHDKCPLPGNPAILTLWPSALLPPLHCKTPSHAEIPSSVCVRAQKAGVAVFKASTLKGDKATTYQPLRVGRATAVYTSITMYMPTA